MDQYRKGRYVFHSEFSREYKQKRIPVSTHKYKDWGVYGENSIEYHSQDKKSEKQIITPEVKYIDGTLVVKLCGLNIENGFFNTKLPLNEDDNNFDGKLNYINYKRKVMKLHDASWGKSFHLCWCFYNWLWMWCVSVSSIL